MSGTRGLFIAIAAAFIVGCSVGLMGGILFMRFGPPVLHGPFMAGGMHGGPPPLLGPGDPRGPVGGGHEERILTLLERELDLTPVQRERIVAQIDRARDAHAAARESMQVWLERDLNPAQRERWKQMQARFEQSRRGPGSHVPWSPGRP